MDMRGRVMMSGLHSTARSTGPPALDSTSSIA